MQVKEKERERSEQEAREAALRKYARSAATLAVGALTWHLPHSAAVSDQGDPSAPSLPPVRPRQRASH